LPIITLPDADGAPSPRRKGHSTPARFTTAAIDWSTSLDKSKSPGMAGQP
jgi:hypothetical protein